MAPQGRRWWSSVVWTAATITSLYLVFVALPVGRAIDQAVFVAVRESSARAVVYPADWLLRLLSPTVTAITVGGVVAVAVVLKRRDVGLAAAAAMCLAVLAAEVAKGALAAAPAARTLAFLPGTGSFPSGHIAFVAALVIAAIRLTSLRVRPAVTAAGR